MFAIVCDEIGKQFFEFWRRTRTPFGFESAGNHGLGAATNQIPRSVVVQRRQTLPCQNDVETEKLEAITSTDEPPRLRPNPVVVEFHRIAIDGKKAGQAGRKEANTAESCGGARPCSDDGRTGPDAIIALADKSAGCSSITSARPLPGAGRKNARGILDAMANIGQNSYILGCEPGTRCAGNGWQ